MDRSKHEKTGRYGGFVLLNMSKEEVRDGDNLDGIIVKTSTKKFQLQVSEPHSPQEVLLKKPSSKSYKETDESDTSDSSSSICITIEDHKYGDSEPTAKQRLRTVRRYSHTSKYKLSIQDEFPHRDHSLTTVTNNSYVPAATGGHKNDIALDTCLRAQIEDYPDPMCDCACPFIINNTMRENKSPSRHIWRGHFGKKYVAVFIFSFLFLLDDFVTGSSKQWYDIMIACFIGVPYVVLNSLLAFAEYSCICKAKSVYCCCHPEGCCNCFGITCKKIKLCNSDSPKWNCTRCEVFDVCLLCCRRPCLCLVAWACLCCKIGCKEECCHKICPKRCCCGKEGNCQYRCMCGKASVASKRLLVYNLFIYHIIPLIAVAFASMCAVFLDERLEKAIPFIYFVLEVLIYPSVLFLSEILMHFFVRKIFSCIEHCDTDEDDEDE